MSRRTVWTVGFLGVTAAAVAAELWAANDHDPATAPWTEYISTYVPEPVTFTLIGILVGWLGPHFKHAYETRGKAVTVADIPLPPPNPAAEPLITPGLVTSLVTILLGLGVSFGLKLSSEQTGMIVTAVGLVAGVVLAMWGRSRVYSPASTEKLRIEAKAEGRAEATKEIR